MWIRQNYLPTIDLAIMLDVYHALDYPKELAQSILAALKPNGKLVLVEYRAEDAAVPLKQTHKMTQAQAIKALTLLPLKWEKPLTTCLGSM